LGLVNTPSLFIQMAISVLESITPKFVIIYIINIVIQIQTQGVTLYRLEKCLPFPQIMLPMLTLQNAPGLVRKLAFERLTLRG
jgi:hypothetical protein